MRNVYVRIEDELDERLDIERVKRRLTKPTAVAQAIEQWLGQAKDAGGLAGALAAEAERQQAPAIPGIFNGLSNDDIWTLQNLAAILRERPQGSIYRAALFALDQAVTEYRANLSKQPDGAARREKTGT